MKGKILLTLVSSLMILSLFLVSCGTSDTVDEDGDRPSVKVTKTGGAEDQEADEEDTQEEAVDSGDPKYGGTLTFLSPDNPSIFMPAVQNRGISPGIDGYVMEQILGIDRTVGPAGTGETSYGEGPSDFKYVIGNLVESWATPEIGVWELEVRQGVHFALNPDTKASREVGGREMTADDIAYSIEYMRDTPSTWIQFAEPSLIKNTTVETTGPWSLTVNTPVAPTTTYLWIMGGGGNQYVFPRETLENYGTVNDWENLVGTGPYILKDFVSDSAGTYVRNDNYWDKNPVGPGMGDQLPYPDGLNFLVVPDLSTRLAAIRTGRGDWITNTTSREDTEILLKSNPDIQTYKTIITPLHVGMRVDLDDQPFADKRVRQALMLAIDHPTITAELHDGQAELLDSPARKFYPTVYTPLEELSETIQELYGYYPDKAKALLTEAGYPDGFAATMVIQNTPESTTAAETITAMWSEVGVDIQINVLEGGAFIGTWAQHKSEDLLLTRNAGGTAALFVRYSLGYFRGPNIFNISHVNDPPGTDPIVEAAFERQAANVNVNYPEADLAYKELIPYLLENAFLITMPAAHGFRVWQPWVKNYYGEGSTKQWLRYAWVDEDLKKSMGH